ncbi:MAG: hypothetical protein M1839_002168 [Geoglossum umbratile]|nr:MAG: hypothetical protein M1839_002168 [Geoglossum umbratile]
MVAIINGITTLFAALPQLETNGDSRLGTSDAPQLGDCVGVEGNALSLNSDADTTIPWGDRTVNNSNQYQDTPNTGETRYYDFTLSYAKLSPDGVERDMIVVNDMFPGPTIEANWGDWIEVTVKNNLDEGTSLHWHGLLQKTTPWADGVPGVTQCPIAPGASYVYRFQADLYGSSWWHSHYSAQYSAGAVGPMIIHGPKQYTRDIDLGPVLLTDWYHRDYISIVEDIVGTDTAKVIPAAQPDNALINGKNNFDCEFADPGQKCISNSGLSKFNFNEGRSHILRVINSGSDAVMYFSIDEHELEVVSVDFVPIMPYKTNVIALGVGQRMDVIVEGIGKEGSNYWMRSHMAQGAGCTGVAHPENDQALAVVFYDGALPTSVPTSKGYEFPDPCIEASISETEPVYQITPDTNPATTFELNIGLRQTEAGNLEWPVNDSSFRVDFSDPVLLGAYNGRVDYPENWNVYNEYDNKTTRFVVINNTPSSHPMHMHGHNFFVLATGDGLSWDGEISRPSNPTRRDTQIVAPFSFIVVQIEANNPGIWGFHCHIAWHVSAGLYIQTLEQRSEIMANKEIPVQFEQTCDAWNEWTKTHEVIQIDSGLRMMHIRERSEYYNSLLRG